MWLLLGRNSENSQFSNFTGGVLTDISQGFVQDGTPYTFITGNTFTNSATVLKSGAMVVRNTAFTKNAIGVVFLQRQWSRATSNTFSKDTNSGIFTDLDGLTVGMNRATNDGRYGVYAPAAINLGRTVAFGNGLANCVGLVSAGK